MDIILLRKIDGRQQMGLRPMPKGCALDNLLGLCTAILRQQGVTEPVKPADRELSSKDDFPENADISSQQAEIWDYRTRLSAKLRYSLVEAITHRPRSVGKGSDVMQGYSTVREVVKSC